MPNCATYHSFGRAGLAAVFAFGNGESAVAEAAVEARVFFRLGLSALAFELLQLPSALRGDFSGASLACKPGDGCFDSGAVCAGGAEAGPGG